MDSGSRPVCVNTVAISWCMASTWLLSTASSARNSREIRARDSLTRWFSTVPRAPSREALVRISSTDWGDDRLSPARCRAFSTAVWRSSSRSVIPSPNRCTSWSRPSESVPCTSLNSSRNRGNHAPLGTARRPMIRACSTRRRASACTAATSDLRRGRQRDLGQARRACSPRSLDDRVEDCGGRHRDRRRRPPRSGSPGRGRVADRRWRTARRQRRCHRRPALPG